MTVNQYAALLRGINLGGNNKVSMADDAPAVPPILE